MKIFPKFHEITQNDSFAILTLRKNANRYLVARKDLAALNQGELYILDEVYGKSIRSESR